MKTDTEILIHKPPKGKGIWAYTGGYPTRNFCAWVCEKPAEINDLGTCNPKEITCSQCLKIFNE